MNIWIAKLGLHSFSPEDLQRLSSAVENITDSKGASYFEYKADSVHYMSFTPDQEKWNKQYHHKNDSMTGFSGILVGNGKINIDFRSAKNISENINQPEDITDISNGQFALFRCKDKEFDCIVDVYGSYKVFYYSDNHHVFVSNNHKLIKLFKPSEPNVEFYANYIAASGTYGIYTDEEGIFILPEAGKFSWSVDKGLQVSRYRPLSELLTPEGSYKDLLNQAAESLRGSAEYLSKYHKAAISLSGGFDSRLVLNMFWGLDPQNISCYTFKDNPPDIKLAQATAKDHGFRHYLLQPSEIPSLDEMHHYSENILSPFRNYDNVAGYIFLKHLDELYTDKRTVILNGNGGDIDDYGLKKFKKLHHFEEKQAIEYVLKRIIDKKILTDDGYQQIHKHLKNHYESKYLPFMKGQGKQHRLRLYYFLLERFGQYHGFKFLYTFQHKDLFLPFATLDFLNIALCSSRKELPRKHHESLHRDLSRMFTNGKDKAIPFTSDFHWSTGKTKRLRRKIYQRFLSRYLDRYKKKDDKFSTITRSTFYNNNVEHYKEVFHSSQHSALWDYFDRQEIITRLERGQYHYEKGGEILSKIVPLLKTGL